LLEVQGYRHRLRQGLQRNNGRAKHFRLRPGLVFVGVCETELRSLSADEQFSAQLSAGIGGNADQLQCIKVQTKAARTAVRAA
jgi:hypothetical protein